MAAGLQVHNDSLPTLAFAAADFFDEFESDFDAANPAHLGLGCHAGTGLPPSGAR